jgi:hypothetical protein
MAEKIDRVRSMACCSVSEIVLSMQQMVPRLLAGRKF